MPRRKSEVEAYPASMNTKGPKAYNTILLGEIRDEKQGEVNVQKRYRRMQRCLGRRQQQAMLRIANRLLDRYCR
jgi:hypothetical protein